MMDSKMTIREMCDTFNVTPRTLRFYEAKELLFPERQGQRRLYGKSERARLQLILRGKRFGFSLEELRQLLDLYNADENHETQLREAFALAEQHLATMEAQRAELDDAIVDMKLMLDGWSKRLAEFDTPQARAS